MALTSARAPQRGTWVRTGLPKHGNQPKLDNRGPPRHRKRRDPHAKSHSASSLRYELASQTWRRGSRCVRQRKGQSWPLNPGMRCRQRIGPRFLTVSPSGAERGEVELVRGPGHSNVVCSSFSGVKKGGRCGKHGREASLCQDIGAPSQNELGLCPKDIQMI